MQIYGQSRLCCLEDMISNTLPMIWVSRLKKCFCTPCPLQFLFECWTALWFPKGPSTSIFYNHNCLTDLNISAPIRHFLVTAAFLIPLKSKLVSLPTSKEFGVLLCTLDVQFLFRESLVGSDCGRQISWWGSTAVIFQKLHNRKRQFFSALGLVFFNVSLLGGNGPIDWFSCLFLLRL